MSSIPWTQIQYQDVICCVAFARFGLRRGNGLLSKTHTCNLSNHECALG